MRRFVKIGLTLALWAFVAGFVLYFGHRAEVHRSKTAVRELQVVIEDSLRDESLVTSALVRSWIARGKIATVELLTRKNFLIKDLTSKMGADGRQFLRIAVRNENDDDLLAEAIRDVMTAEV